MAGIAATGQTPIRTTAPNISREKKEEVATGVGAAAGITSASGLANSATRAAGKKALKAEAAEKTLGKMLDGVQTASRNVSKNTKEVTGLWKTFKANIAKYTNQLNGYVAKFKETKYIGAIIKSPVTKYLTKFFGGALAFFVLVTGVSKAVRTGAIAVDDFKSQYNDLFGDN